MRLHERIVMDPEILAGKPVIRGTRLAVEFILELLAAGQTEAEILDSYPGLTREDILACLEYARSGEAPNDQFNIETALEGFRNTDFATPSDGNTFFEKHGVGNAIAEMNHPFERFRSYKELMCKCQALDPSKYEHIHKGTPFYFMSWLCFDMRAYNEALFYIDSAISEDIRADKGGPTPNRWKDAPAARFLTLDAKSSQAAKRTIKEIAELLQVEFDRFNGISQRPAMTLERWRAFVDSLLEAPSQDQHSKRTIVSALYIFMLAFNHQLQQLELRRGSVGGSNQPFTVHLFTGGLLFESLLKHFYPKGTPDLRQIGDCLKHPRFRAHWGSRQIDCSAGSLQQVCDVARTNASSHKAFEVAVKLRNTTGHNLVWDDVFEDPTAYKALYEQLMNALLYLIEKNTDELATTGISTEVQITTVTTTESITTTQTALPLDAMSYSSTVTVERTSETVRDKPTTNTARTYMMH